jgi:hypothetical protein
MSDWLLTVYWLLTLYWLLTVLATTVYWLLTVLAAHCNSCSLYWLLTVIAAHCTGCSLHYSPVLLSQSRRLPRRCIHLLAALGAALVGKVQHSTATLHCTVSLK